MKELIETRQIRAFVAVARRGSFNQGARDVFLTQSAVSHAIKSLERDIGCDLFRRVGRRAMLTNAGERLLQHCEDILHKMQNARADLTQNVATTRECLRIGAPMTVCQHLLPAAWGQVQHEFPQWGLRVETADNPQLLINLVAGRIDLAIVVEPDQRPDLNLEPLFNDELRFVMLPDHPWAGAATITEKQIRSETLVIAKQGTRTHQLITAYFRSLRIAFDKVIELGSIEAIKEMVKNRLGVGVLAHWPIQSELERGELVTRPLGTRKLSRTWYVAYLRQRALRPSDDSVIRSLKQQSANFASDL